MDEQSIIQAAFTHLQNELGKTIQWHSYGEKNDDLNYDATFLLNGHTIYIEAKNEIRPIQVKPLHEIKEQLGNLLVVAKYITPTAKKLLKEKCINYMDIQGNTWFKFDQIHIYLEGTPSTPLTALTKNRAFTKAGIKVVFQLLLDKELLDTTYRNLAKKADVALGTIPKVIDGLKAEGFILKRNEKQLLLTNFEELLNRWQQEYVKKLKPTLYLNRYRPTDPDFNRNWKEIQLPKHTVWGGEPAADLLTKYLNPQEFTLYTNQTQQEIIRTYRWVPDNEGEIFVYKKFWEDDNQNNAPALLVYAELMETKDSRCIETANLIYEKYLQKP
jgi:hypothetical protein